MKPIYAENIIVAIKSCGCIEWYIFCLLYTSDAADD